MESAFDQIRVYARGDLAVSLRLLRALTDVAAIAANDRVHRPLLDLGHRIIASCADHQDERSMERLRGRLTGIAQPTYVLDIPGGYGKAPIGPSYIADRDDGAYAVRDWQGIEHVYVTLRSEAEVAALVPDAQRLAPFGHVGVNHLRFSYANSRENIVEAVKRTRAVVEPLVEARHAAAVR